MDPFMNIFKGVPFSVASMTEGVARVPHMPTQIGDMKLFNVKRSRTEVIGIEAKGGQLSLIKTSKRGAPLEQRETDGRDIFYMQTSRIAKKDHILASEIAFVRKFNTEGQIQALVDELNDRMSGPTGLVSDVNYTWEHMRLGATQGKVLDADGKVIVDWFDKFGITQPALINFTLATIKDGNLRKKVEAEVIRPMEKAAQGARYLGIHALCGDTFWDLLMANVEVRETYLNQQAASDLREGYNGQVFQFAGVDWERYRGSDDGKVAIGADQVRFFPKGAGNTVFDVAFAPGETFADIGTEGQLIYSMVVPDLQRDQWVDLEVYSYPLWICKRPEMLLSGKA